MADDAPFIEPLGEFTPPIISTDVDGVVRILLEAIETAGDDQELVVHGATGKRLGAPWFATVQVELDSSRAFMSPGTARKVAAAIANDRTTPLPFGGRGQVAALFTLAADQADSLTAAANARSLT